MFRKLFKGVFKVDHLSGEVRQLQTPYGHEVPDSTPVAIPAGFKRPETMEEIVKRMVRTQISREAAEKGEETFEEADDFEVDDDFDPSTPYEVLFDPVLEREVSPAEFERNAAGYENRYKKAMMKQFQQLDEEGIIEDNLRRKWWREKQEKPKDKGGPETKESQTK